MSWSYFYTFGQTCALELPFYAFALRRRIFPAGLSAVVALNALTHPLVFFAFISAQMPLIFPLLAGESFAIALEAWACWYFLGARPVVAVAVSVAANLVSWQLAPLLTYAIFF